MDQPSGLEELIAEARRGNRQAFTSLAGLWRKRLEALIRLRLGSDLRRRVEVEDVLQEVFLRAFQGLPELRAEEGPAVFAWFIVIATNVIADLGRRHVVAQGKDVRREVSLERPCGAREDGASLADALAADLVSPSKGMRREERFLRLERALEKLSPEHREVILLAKVENVPIQEIARRWDKSPRAVSMQILRALRALKSAFGHTDSLHLPDRELAREDATEGRREGLGA